MLTAQKDHPRIRGEHRGGASGTDDIPGSSPHTRGAPGFKRDTTTYTGIIPAYAGSTRRRPDRVSWIQDHPRIRGEHPHDPLRGRLSAGIIPAYAGSTSAGRRASRSRSDHPRIRGEHQDPTEPSQENIGSSPHTRGAHLQQPESARAGGIIPAYAGSTPTRPRPSRCRRDHPRIRGEHSICLKFCHLTIGSSPHTRGARLGVAGVGINVGIIPAYAGSTWVPSTYPALAADHPRIRGEHGPVDGHVDQATGSSPHTRGARTVGRLPVSLVGIIPAYAGSTPTASGTTRRGTDHPRIRGEHEPSHPAAVLMPGSSPHTRGAHARLPASPSLRRIIPAYAGSTRSPSSSLPGRADHPRIRGEHESLKSAFMVPIGSSPHTRGAPRKRRRTPARRRIIPAYAGSTPASSPTR